MSNQTKHILVIRLSALGDVAMVEPVLRVLTQQYPDLRITVLTKAFYQPIFRDLRNVTVLKGDFKKRHKGISGLFTLSKEIKALNIDAVADLHNVLRSNILKYFLGKKTIQINKGRSEKKKLISGQRFTQLKTSHQRYAEVFESLGYSIKLSNWSPPKKASLSSHLLSSAPFNEKSVIGIAPFAAHKGKMYPFNLMKKVINELSKEHQIILFGGGEQEIKLLNQIENEVKNTVSIAGKFSLNEELDVISNLDVMLSMDSGNAHLAAMFGIKVVTIWGVTHPFAGFAPFNQPQDYMLLANREQFPQIPTSVYGNKYPLRYEDAAGSISPDTVVNKIRSII